MANLFDYLDWRGDITFSEVGLNEIDSLILSTLCYVDMENIVPPDHAGRSIALVTAAKQYLHAHRGEPAYLGAIVPPQIITLLAMASKTKRFGNIRLTGYVNRVDAETQLQFSALTYVLGNGNIYVAFRGTDDTLVGWKENFNMSFMSTVPAQSEALKYLTDTAGVLGGGIYVGGHSKGGNLAVFSSVRCADEIKQRIVTTYNNDGPGFSEGFISEEDYLSIREKIKTFLPQSSVVGMLLEHEENYEVVKSTETGLLQHDPFSWSVLGGKFIYLDSISEESLRIDKAVKGWLSEMDMSQREEFVDAIYETLSASGASTLTDIFNDKAKLLRAWGNLSDENKTLVMNSIKILVKENMKAKKK